MNISLITLYVRDMDRTSQFYTKVLGYRVFEEQSDPNFILLLSESGTPLALQRVSTVPAGQVRPLGGFELSYEVADVNQVYAQWKAAGVKLLSGVEEKPFGVIFTAQDPEGTILSVVRLNQKLGQAS